MTESVYSFIRAELRTIQFDCKGDNEEFLNIVADIIGNRDKKIRELEDQITAMRWGTNPDRSGGQFTDDEVRNYSIWR